MCGHGHLHFISLVTSQYSSEISLKVWNQKKKLTIFASGFSIYVGACLQHSVYNSLLAFTFYLCIAWGSANSENLRPSQVFLSLYSTWGIHMVFWFPRNWGSFSKPIFSKHLTPQSLLPSFLVCLLYAPTAICCLIWHQLINLPLNVFNKCPSCLPLFFGRVSVIGKMRVALYTICQGTNRQARRTTIVLWVQSPLCIL